MGYQTRRFGTLVQGRRKEHKLSQVDLARRVGVGQPTISAWESGKNIPSLPTLRSLARHLGLSERDLVDAAMDDQQTWVPSDDRP